MPIWTNDSHFLKDTVAVHSVASRNGQRALPWSNGETENQNWQLKHCSSKTGWGHAGTKGWLTSHQQGMLTLNMRGAKGVSPQIDSSGILGDLGGECHYDNPILPTEKGCWHDCAFP